MIDLYNIIFIILGSIIGYLTSFLKKKGENQATKQDIGIITDKVEEIKTKYTSQLEKARSELKHQAIAKKEKREVYKEISDTMLIFLKGGNSNIERIEKFHSNYQYIWLWASDDVVKAISHFLKLSVKNSINTHSPEFQAQVKKAYVECIISMRKDLIWDKTSLSFNDYEFVNIIQDPNRKSYT